MTILGQTPGQRRPGCAGIANELRLQRRQRKQASPSRQSNPVKAFQFQKALTAMIDHAGTRRRHTATVERTQRVMLGQQQVAPTLGDRIDVGQTKLDQDVTHTMCCLRQGGKFRLFASCRRSWLLAVGGFLSQARIGLDFVLLYYRQGGWNIKETLTS